MTAPRLEIDLDKIHHNASTLVERLGARGIGVTGITKAALGAPEIAATLIAAGVRGLGDSRVENIETMRRAGISAPMTLIRSPMPSQVKRVVAQADISFNTELEVVGRLSFAAQAARRTHGIVLMVELGDLREGIMPGDLESSVLKVLSFPNIALRGIGTNLACRSGVAPDARNMAELSALADRIDAGSGGRLGIVSGGNSANLSWALSGADTGRINDLRLGEAILLGREPLHRRPIDGLHTDAITLIAEAIESKLKPSRPWGEIGQSAFGAVSASAVKPDSGHGMQPGRTVQTIFALGRQDTDPDGLVPPDGIDVLGCSSDHLIVGSSGHPLSVGAEIRFQLNYSALARAMTSPFVARVMKESSAPIRESAATY
ncbi:MAG: alanine/ornithine racemase family PLP-dependent enzyme [Rhodospirillaceae bacterium]|jgi:ornithine racemase|nr:alanine/ornithine racemase family PLP-dependent enzyme [Rhodospirillaceae bacterium]